YDIISMSYLFLSCTEEFNIKFENLADIVDDPDASENLKAFARKKLKRLETHIRDSLEIAFFISLTPLVPLILIGCL
ncbi:hypothetical protein FPK88_27845, partial [Acinetobacter baumannii]|nr:hypothetical protein [Acinetobacter baumannii]